MLKRMMNDIAEYKIGGLFIEVEFLG